ncbi:MAG: Outer membrane protein transport protein (OMPP1/FadL/TodX) [Elusimicrobia bacterium ADurb.Bin231]|nr:MAG: Outer membrane protein transport protein (OMPP1/FadL/TodX) [Elusimicrobia bacterium ADurb.Bin231]
MPVAAFSSGEGGSAAPVLKLESGARSSGMGGSFCGIADDIDAVQYNPAGLVQLHRKEIMLAHNEWIEGVKNEFVGFGMPINEYWTAAIALNYMHVDGLTGRDDSGTPTGKTFGGYNGLLTLNLCAQVSEGMYVGGNIKVVQESVDNRKGTAFCADAGFLYRLNNWRFGASVLNAGTEMELYEDSFPLPLTVKTGVSYMMLKNTLLLTCDANNRKDTGTDVRAGAEYVISEMFVARAGYKTNAAKNTGSGVTCGVSINHQDWNVDYAFLPYGDFGNTHRVSVSYKFGGRK